jgi:hypothetical protein
VSLIPFQVQLEAALAAFPRVATLMQMHWSWPIAESIHFVGLTLLFGAIAAWDLRLLGVAKQIPLAAFHRLVPFSVLGFALNAGSGVFFLMTDGDQYIYNPAFHLKMLCVMLAGVNAAIFYLMMFRRGNALVSGLVEPAFARVSGAVSLILWMTVIVCGRMITFYRPNLCRAGEAAGFLADCIVRAASGS